MTPPVTTVAEPVTGAPPAGGPPAEPAAPPSRPATPPPRKPAPKRELRLDLFRGLALWLI
ncbi:OpgC domain-containing protein, partial [Rhodopseudomonas sp. BR0C11]|nr:OpgC domain-containing protein [Rhodopseudomonas sp. BR0C11]